MSSQGGGMHDIGIGGTLSFDAAPALHGMQTAAHGFEQMDHARENFSHNLENLGQKFDQFNLIAAGLGVAGVAGFHQLIHSSFEASAEAEQAQIAIGTALGMARGKGFNAGFEMAGHEMELMKNKATDIGVGFEDMYGIFKQVVLPLSTAGASMEKIRNMTKQTAIAAMATGEGLGEMGSSITRFLAGFIRARDPLFMKMKMSRLVSQDMTAEDVQSMTPQARMSLISNVLKRYGEAEEKVTHTWRAVWQSLSNIITDVKEAFSTESGLFKAIEDDVAKIRVYWSDHKKEIMETAAIIGSHLKPVYVVLKEAVFGIIKDAIKLGKIMDGWIDKAKTFAVSLGMSDEKLHKLAVGTTMFAIAFGTILPVLSILKFMWGPIGAVIGVVTSGVGYLIRMLTSIPSILMAAFANPVGLALITSFAALSLLFLALRKDGESFGETVMRIWTDYIQPFVSAFSSAFGEYIPTIMEPLQEAWDMIKDAFVFLSDYLSDTFVASADSASGAGSALGQVFAGISIVITHIIGYFGKLIASALYATTWIIWGFKEIGKYIGEAMGFAVNLITNMLAGVGNLLLMPFRLALDFMAYVVSKIASTKLGAMAMKLAGVDPAEVVKLAKDLSNSLEIQTNVGLNGFSGLDETPDQEVERKRAARLDKPQEVRVDLHHQEDVTVHLKLDDREVAAAVARHNVEISERAGAKITPWQRRMAVAHAGSGQK